MMPYGYDHDRWAAVTCKDNIRPHKGDHMSSEPGTVQVYNTGPSNLPHLASATDKYILVWMIHCMRQKPK